MPSDDDEEECLSHEEHIRDQSQGEAETTTEYDEAFPLALRNLRPYLDPSSSASLDMHSKPFSPELRQAMSVAVGALSLSRLWM